MSDKTACVRCTIFKDGPIEVTGPVTILDEDGNVLVEVEAGEPAYLCRCGGSKDKPYCDGTHDDIKFDGTFHTKKQ